MLKASLAHLRLVFMRVLRRTILSAPACNCELSGMPFCLECGNLGMEPVERKSSAGSGRRRGGGAGGGGAAAAWRGIRGLQPGLILAPGLVMQPPGSWR